MNAFKYIYFKYLKYMNNNDLNFLPYTATSISIFARGIFMFLLYKNKSTNSLSLLFCILSISSSSMWVFYSIKNNDFKIFVCVRFQRRSDCLPLLSNITLMHEEKSI